MNNDVQTNPSETMPQQPVTNPQTPQSKSERKLNWKGFFIGIIVVIVIWIIVIPMLKSDNKQNISALPPTPAPTASPQITNNPTANWKTFSDQTLHISFEYPSDWKVVTSTGHIILQPLKDNNPTRFQQIGFPTSIQVEATNNNNDTDYLQNFIKDPTNSQSLVLHITSKDIPKPQYKETQYLLSLKDTAKYHGAGTIINITIVKNGNEKVAFADFSDSNTLLSQILNSFNFTDNPPISCRPRPACLDAKPRCMIAETADMCPPATPTPPQTACAQDAKICPDGSYVSRTGPDCEFAACPN